MCLILFFSDYQTGNHLFWIFVNPQKSELMFLLSAKINLTRTLLVLFNFQTIDLSRFGRRFELFFSLSRAFTNLAILSLSVNPFFHFFSDFICLR